MSSLTHIIENSSNGGDKKEIWSGNFKRARRKLRTYFHGLNEIFNAPNYPMRIFWLSVVISAVFCACWMSQWLLEGAMQQRTVAKIEYLTPDTLKYPIITICDRSGSKFLNYTQLANDNVTDEFLKMMFLSGPIWVLPYSQIPRPTLLNDSDAQMFLSAWQGNSSDATMGLRRFLLHYSLTCEEIFSSCRDANWDKLNCCKMFSPVFHLRQGICYASNPDFIPSMVASGLFSNLYLKFKRPKDPYRDRKSEKEAKFGYEISIDTGVDQGLWRADVIKLDFGYWAVATFSAKRITTDSTIEVPCDKQPHLDCFKDYTFSNCMWERRLLKNPQINPNDSCTWPIIPLLQEGYIFNRSNNNSARTNESYSQMLCSAAEIHQQIFEPIKISKTSMGLFSGLSHWMNRLHISSLNPCLLPCDFWEYTYTVTEDFQFDQWDIAGLTVTMRDSQYSHIREVPSLEWVDYVALIGGTWGLWTGGSVIAVIHMLVQMAKCLCCCLKDQNSDRNLEEDQ